MQPVMFFVHYFCLSYMGDTWQTLSIIEIVYGGPRCAILKFNSPADLTYLQKYAQNGRITKSAKKVRSLHNLKRTKKVKVLPRLELGLQDSKS